MKKFLTILGSFAVVLFLMCAVIEVALLFRPNVYAYKRQYMDEHLHDIKILLLGSSHIEEAVKPELVGEGTFNLAISARLKEYDAALAEMYVPRMDSLKVIVMAVDYTNFFFERWILNPASSHHAPESLVSSCRCMHTKYMGTRIDPFWYWSEILNSRLNFMSRFWNNRQKLQECDSLGYVRLDPALRASDWEYRALPALIDSTKAIDPQSYQELYDSYAAVARLAQPKGVRLILVTPPVYKTYQQAVNPIVRQDMHDFCQKLHEAYPCVEYYDMLYEEGYLAEDFNDSSHLSDDGAVKFSHLLSEIISRRRQ